MTDVSARCEQVDTTFGARRAGVPDSEKDLSPYRDVVLIREVAMVRGAVYCRVLRSDSSGVQRSAS